MHALAVAYLGAGRFADARERLHRALAAEPAARIRAGLLTTLTELHHMTWSEELALQAAGAALTELGHPLPRRRLWLVLTTLGIAAAGALVGAMRIGAGTARGRRRADLTAVATVLDAGAYAAAIGMRVREAGVFALRALYAVNRLGPGPQYVRVYATLGYVAALLKLRGRAEGCFDKARHATDTLGDPALVAYLDWVRGSALHLGGIDDGTAWEQAVTRHARWLVPAQYITGLASTGLRLVLRGHTREAQAAYERGLTHLPDPQQAAGTSFAMLSVLIPAQQGHPAEAASALAKLRTAFPPGTGTPMQRANIGAAASCAIVEQGEFGALFDEVIAEFEAIGLRPAELMAQQKWFYVYRAHGRLAQLRLAPDGERAARLAVAERAVRELGQVTDTALLKAAYALARAALTQQRGRPDKAIRMTDRLERATRSLDAPLVSFELARIRARALRELGLTGEAERQARHAHLLATTYGWEHRRRHVRVEFGVDDTHTASRFTQAVDRSQQAARNRRLEALQQVSAAASTVLDPQLLARVALDETLRILGAERALLFLIDDAGAPVPFVGRDSGGADLDAATGYGSTLVARVLDSGEALVVTGTDEGAALGSQSVVLHGLRSIMVTPVRLKGKVIGVVYLDSRLARGVFTEDDVEVLTAITSHVAISLETARAAQLDLAVSTARRQQELAEALRASLTELAAILDPDAVLEHLFRTMCRQIEASAGWLLYCGDGEATVVATAGTADPGILLDPAGHRDLATLCAPESPIVLTDSDLPAPLRALVGAHPYALVVPLVARSGRVGMVVLGGEALDDTGREVAAALAGQGMIAYDNARLFSRVQELATTDELTRLHNRRHFYAQATELVERARRDGTGLAAVMLDIDRFKHINDSYGHGVGDDVIQEVARRLRSCVRPGDVLGRYGGEEFAALLPIGHALDADLAERMRHAVGSAPVATRGGPVEVTISVGVAHLAPDDALEQLLGRADRSLYRAKEAGRNRVVVG
jgi:diguanylate cyclase (GGDEF)-like protein